MAIDHHVLLLLVISMLNAQNGIYLIIVYNSYGLLSINKSTRCINGTSSCTDLILTSNTNISSKLNPAPYKMCHLVFRKINFNIPLPHHLIDKWDSKSANVEMI